MAVMIKKKQQFFTSPVLSSGVANGSRTQEYVGSIGLLFWVKNNTNVKLNARSVDSLLMNFRLLKNKNGKLTCFVCGSDSENNVEWVARNEDSMTMSLPMFHWVNGQHSCLPCWLDAFVRKIHMSKK